MTATDNALFSLYPDSECGLLNSNSSETISIFLWRTAQANGQEAETASFSKQFLVVGASCFNG